MFEKFSKSWLYCCDTYITVFPGGSFVSLNDVHRGLENKQIGMLILKAHYEWLADVLFV